MRGDFIHFVIVEGHALELFKLQFSFCLSRHAVGASFTCLRVIVNNLSALIHVSQPVEPDFKKTMVF